MVLPSAHDETGKPIVLAVLKGGEKKPRVDVLKTIPKRLQETIKEVCTDLYDGFIHAAEEVLPQATIVADRFPVTKLYRAAVDALRKTELKALKGALMKEQYAGLKGVLWALRKSPSFAIGPGTSSSFHATERFVFQTVSLVFLSRAAMYCKSAPSNVRISRFSNATGDEDAPR